MAKSKLIRDESIETGWTLFRMEPGSAAEPAQIDKSRIYNDAIVPGTVAESLAKFHEPDEAPEINYDEFDWWYQCSLKITPKTSNKYHLCFDGLSTIVEVWLNGKRIHTSRNMFRQFRIDVSQILDENNILTLVFRSLGSVLRNRKPRPKWRTNLVSHQQLRWIRTTLLGRIPGWTPAVQPVGPWRKVRLERASDILVSRSAVIPLIKDDKGQLVVNLRLEKCNPSTEVHSAKLSIFGRDYLLQINNETAEVGISGEIDLGIIPLWWPHTEGDPTLHDYAISVEGEFGSINVKSGRVGFRNVTTDRSNGGLTFVVNNLPLFCRGACWTVGEIRALGKDTQSLRHTLELMRNAGANMIRIGGTMLYESNRFYELCDELGIMIWQDFMFANMDYPIDDSNFEDDVSSEIEQQIDRLSAHSCVVAYCGNSEVEQQASMVGRTETDWRNRLFYDVIPNLLKNAGAAQPYFPSSPCEGTLPFQNSEGVSHYFGVGAYKRPVDDLIASNVKFTTECLGFSNIPCDHSLIRHFGTTFPVTHDPQWKKGVPRDSGAGWDFEDIRDHYVKELFGLDPIKLRSSDKERYISISKVVTGELMQAAYNYWMHSSDECGGAISWFLKDIVPGAGWGIIDSDNIPKPAYYFLKRAWSGFGISLLDCGLSGLQVVLRNIKDTHEDVEVEVRLLQSNSSEVARSSKSVSINSMSPKLIYVNEIFEQFYDTTYAYRFGPPQYDLVIASVRGQDISADAFYFPSGRNLPILYNAEIQTELKHRGNDIKLTIYCDKFLQNVEIFTNAHSLSDNYFHLAPNTKKIVRMTSDPKAKQSFRCTVGALNVSRSFSPQ